MQGTINTCSGVFADAGDTNGDYTDSENYSMTFCSDENNQISFTFEHFNTEAGSDILTIYDGADNSATQIGAYSGFGPANSPGVVTSSSTCLTFEFASNGNTTSLGWLATISCTGSPLVNAISASWTGYDTGNACAATEQIGGFVYEDINNNGIQDTREGGIAGTSVAIYDDNGQVGSAVITDENGEYNFTGLTASNLYRIEFIIPQILKEGAYGEASQTNVQFVEAGTCDVNLGVIDPHHYCDTTNLSLIHI